MDATLLDRVGADVPAPEDPADAGGAELLRGYLFAVAGDLVRCESTLQGAVTLLRDSPSTEAPSGWRASPATGSGRR